jgi:hypothetical protein
MSSLVLQRAATRHWLPCVPIAGPVTMPGCIYPHKPQKKPMYHLVGMHLCQVSPLSILFSSYPSNEGSACPQGPACLSRGTGLCRKSRSRHQPRGWQRMALPQLAPRCCWACCWKSSARKAWRRSCWVRWPGEWLVQGMAASRGWGMPDLHRLLCGACGNSCNHWLLVLTWMFWMMAPVFLTAWMARWHSLNSTVADLAIPSPQTRTGGAL